MHQGVSAAVTVSYPAFRNCGGDASESWVDRHRWQPETGWPRPVPIRHCPFLSICPPDRNLQDRKRFGLAGRGGIAHLFPTAFFA